MPLLPLWGIIPVIISVAGMAVLLNLLNWDGTKYYIFT
jgi:hypothetical protein